MVLINVLPSGMALKSALQLTIFKSFNLIIVNLKLLSTYSIDVLVTESYLRTF